MYKNDLEIMDSTASHNTVLASYLAGKMSGVSREQLGRIAFEKREEMAELARNALALLRKRGFTRDDNNVVLNDATRILGHIGFFATYGDDSCRKAARGAKGLYDQMRRIAGHSLLADFPELVDDFFEIAMSRPWQLAKPPGFLRRLKAWFGKSTGIEIERDK